MGFALPPPANAGDITRSTEISCLVSRGTGAISYGRSKHLGAAAGTHKVAPWVFAQDGMRPSDQINLFWSPANSPQTALRAAIDGPVSKPARVISTAGGTLAAVAVTSDQQTTRTWLLTVNFPNEIVMVAATASGAVAVKSQVMALSCDFADQEAANLRTSASDNWRRK